MNKPNLKFSQRSKKTIINIAFIFCVIIYGKCKNKEFVKEADE